MSELKATTVYDAYWTANSVGEGTGIQVYLKSEADKVIAHNKRKRCLAMYRYCAIKALYELDLKGNDVEWKWYSKWMHYWFNLAKEPTWAKFLQLIHKEAK